MRGEGLASEGGAKLFEPAIFPAGYRFGQAGRAGGEIRIGRLRHMAGD